MYAKSLEELVEMMEILGEELSTIGLEMHESKTKILTSISEHQYHFVEVYGMMIELLPSDKAHRYLGRMVSLNSSIRCGVEVSNRLQSVWTKFHQYRRWLLTKHVSLHLRLRLFAAVVTSCAFFVIMFPPLNQRDFHRIGAVQQKMLCSIVG